MNVKISSNEMKWSRSHTYFSYEKAYYCLLSIIWNQSQKADNFGKLSLKISCWKCTKMWKVSKWYFRALYCALNFITCYTNAIIILHQFNKQEDKWFQLWIHTYTHSKMHLKHFVLCENLYFRFFPFRNHTNILTSLILILLRRRW